MNKANQTPRDGFFQSQRLKLHYAEWGSADAPILILLHGGRDHCRNWDWVAAELANDWRIIAPDLRGHGDSQWCLSGTYSYESYMWDLLTLIDHLDIPRLNIVGHSLGGIIAMRLAAAFPQRMARMVSIEGLGRSPKELESLYRPSYTQRTREAAQYRLTLPSRVPHQYTSVEAAIAHFHSRNPTLSEAQAVHLATHGLRISETGIYTWKFDDFSRIPAQIAASEQELRDLIANVTCPVLLPWGGESFLRLEDNLTRIEGFADAKVSLYPNAGHWLHHDELQRFVGEIREFMAPAMNDQ